MYIFESLSVGILQRCSRRAVVNDGMYGIDEVQSFNCTNGLPLSGRNHVATCRAEIMKSRTLQPTASRSKPEAIIFNSIFRLPFALSRQSFNIRSAP